jgi:uncharacterized small protein (DUF1192 family)
LLTTLNKKIKGEIQTPFKQFEEFEELKERVRVLEYEVMRLKVQLIKKPPVGLE